MPTVEDALDYALGRAPFLKARGWTWPIIPVFGIRDGHCACYSGASCRSPGKHPIPDQGSHEATTNEVQIREWWDAHPDANIGLATGRKSGIVVVDCDVKGQGPEEWRNIQDINGRCDTLATSTSSGGNHHLFQIDEGTILTNTQSPTIGMGIDSRGEGGYAVIPPSVGINGPYLWMREDNAVNPVRPIPEWLLSRWSKPHDYLDTPIELPVDMAKLLEGVDQGNRNGTAHKLARYFTRHQVDHPVILSVLKAFNERCVPPLPLSELERTIDSAFKWGRNALRLEIDNPPDVVEEGGTLVFIWEDYGVQISLEETLPGAKGIPADKLLISNIDSDRISQHIWGPVDLNLASNSGRDGLIRTLKRRLPTYGELAMTVPWDDIIDTLGRLCNEQMVAGDEVRDLKDYSSRPGSNWAMAPLMLADQPSIIMGQGGTGKSLVTIATMISLNTGTTIIPGLIPEQGHRGLYLDYESTHWEHGERYRQICHGAGIVPDQSVLHLPCSQSLRTLIKSIKRHIVDHKITYLMVDSAGMACGSEPSDEKAAIGFFEALKTLGLPSIVICHQTKSDSNHRPFGSIYWFNFCRNLWESNVFRSDDNELTLALHHRKHNGGALSPPIGIKFTFDNELDSISLSSVAIKDVPELNEGKGDTIAQVMDVLEGTGIPMTTKELVTMIGDGTTWNTVNTTCKRWAEKNRHVRRVTGSKPVQWELA